MHCIFSQQHPTEFVGEYFAEVFCLLQHLLRVKTLNSKLILLIVDNLHLCFWSSVLVVSTYRLFHLLVDKQGGLRYLTTVVSDLAA